MVSESKIFEQIMQIYLKNYFKQTTADRLTQLRPNNLENSIRVKNNQIIQVNPQADDANLILAKPDDNILRFSGIKS